MPELSWIESQHAPGRRGVPAAGARRPLLPDRHARRHTFPYIIEGQHTWSRRSAALDQIEAARPAVGIWDQRPWPRSDPALAGPLDHLFKGLKHRYRMERLPSGVFLLTRIEP